MKQLEKKSNQIWNTYKARFVASERLRKKHDAYAFSISFLSVVQLIASIALLLGVLKNASENNIAFITFVISILILVIANQDFLGKMLDKSRQFHMCANKMHGLNSKLDTAKNFASEYMKIECYKDVSEEYSELLMDADLNHTPLDYAVVQADNSPFFKLKWSERVWVRCRYFSNIYFFPVLFCAAPIVLYFYLCNSPAPTDFFLKMEAYCIENELTMNDLAKKIDLPNEELNRIASGEEQLSAEVAERIKKITGLDYQIFFIK